MSGAQPKAIEIAGGVGIIAEVDSSRIETRHSQGWVKMICESPEEAFRYSPDLYGQERAHGPSPSTEISWTCWNML